MKHQGTIEEFGREDRPLLRKRASEGCEVCDGPTTPRASDPQIQSAADDCHVSRPFVVPEGLRSASGFVDLTDLVEGSERSTRYEQAIASHRRTIGTGFQGSLPLLCS